MDSVTINTCPNCGGNIIGNGYNTPVACEFADVPLDRECDAPILFCAISTED